MPVPVHKIPFLGGLILVAVVLAGIIGIFNTQKSAPPPDEELKATRPEPPLRAENKKDVLPPKPQEAPRQSAVEHSARAPHPSATPVQKALDEQWLGEGIIQYNPPDKIQAEKPVVVTVRIVAPGTDPLAAPPMVDNGGSLQQHKAETYEEMNVDLKGLEGNALAVELKQGGPQIVRNGFADWVWSVTAKKPGTWHLEMSVYAVVYVQGRPPTKKQIKTETSSVTVTVVPRPLPTKVKDFAEHNWQFIWEKIIFGSFGVAVGGYLWRRLLQRKRQQSTENTAPDPAKKQTRRKKGSKTAA